MKSMLAGMFVLSSLAYGAAAVAAAPAGVLHITAPQSAVEQVQSERTCRKLRRDCMFKDERGERGEGNCRRYRSVCERWWR